MLSVNLGPLVLPIGMAVLLAAGLAAAGAGHLAGRRRKVGIVDTLSEMLLVGVAVARVVFVMLWFDTYRDAPWSMLDIRDGGFTIWAGILAALAVALWRGVRQPALRRPLAIGLATGSLVWAAFSGALRLTEKPQLPAVALTTLAGAPTELATLAEGKPLVVNLWASWCPPCRREMPVLAAAQQQRTGVSFVFVNQGEDAATVRRYLDAGRLGLANVLLDPGGDLARAAGSSGLPTTLFYDARGRLVGTHLGELSAASLSSKLKRVSETR